MRTDHIDLSDPIDLRVAPGRLSECADYSVLPEWEIDIMYY